MIRVYGMRVPREARKDDCIAELDPQWYAVWCETHRTGRREARAAESLAALALLKRAGAVGELRYEGGGRPFFANGEIDFSITHAGDHVFCAVGAAENGVRVGIDAEPAVRTSTLDHAALAARWLAGEEAELYRQMPDSETFLRLWTRKEAAVKSVGDGLSSLAATDTVALERSGIFGFTTWKIAGQILTVCHSPEQTVDMAVIFFEASE